MKKNTLRLTHKINSNVSIDAGDVYTSGYQKITIIGFDNDKIIYTIEDTKTKEVNEFAMNIDSFRNAVKFWKIKKANKSVCTCFDTDKSALDQNCVLHPNRSLS